MGHTLAFSSGEKARERWHNDLRPTDGLRFPVRVPQVRRPLPGKLQGQELLVLGPVPLHGLCPVDLPGEPAGYSGLPAGRPTQALPHGVPRHGLPQHARPCQRGARLADLRRLRSGADRDRPYPVRHGSVRGRTGADRLRPGLHRHRSVPGAVPLGHVPQTQRGGKAPHPAGPARPHPQCALPHAGDRARRQYPRYPGGGGRRHLCLRSGLPGLRPAVPPPPRRWASS